MMRTSSPIITTRCGGPTREVYRAVVERVVVTQVDLGSVAKHAIDTETETHRPAQFLDGRTGRDDDDIEGDDDDDDNNNYCYLVM